MLPPDSSTPTKPASNAIYPLKYKKSPSNQSDSKQDGQDGQDGSPQREEKINLLKHPSIFSIGQEELVEFVKENEKRKFAEEIDKIELIGEEGIQRGLNTDFERGIKNDELEKKMREDEYGHNRREARMPESFLSLLFHALGDFIQRILMAAAVFSIVSEVATADDSQRPIAWINGCAIFLAVFVDALVHATNDYQKERQFQKLNKVADSKKQLTVCRNGSIMTLHHSNLLVGDVVFITEGMDLPADGFVIQASELLCDESSMTGETEPIKKDVLKICLKKRNEIINEGGRESAGYHDVPSPILLSGSRVLQGEGKFIVIVVGAKSCVGRIQSKLDQDSDSTPLQMKLEHLARQVGKFGLISAICILIVLFARFAERRIEEGDFKSENVNEIIKFFLIATTVIVVAIPEGLPLSVVISLAYSVQKMLKDNNLVRRLHACETMGGANMICSDKTGTLTQNEMTFTDIWNEKRRQIDVYSKDQPLAKYFPGIISKLFLNSAIVNSSAMLRPALKGSSTEIALLKFVEGCSLNYEEIRNNVKIEQKIPFSSSRKRMSTIISADNEHPRRLFEKGASELVLDACSSYHSFDDRIIPITEDFRKEMIHAIEDMAKDALRTLALAYKNLDEKEELNEKDAKGVYSLEKNNLILICIIGIRDIIRKEVPKAVEDCITAGIKVRMVTGDNRITARAIAKECKIIDPSDENSLVLEGIEFWKKIGGVVCENCKTPECDCAADEKTAQEKGIKVRKDTILNATEFDQIYSHIDVIARCRPEDKYAMVLGLKERNHVVAVTGDGTNDAPALKKADVGFAMGICGTEVAREAASIILLDDNFTSIVKAVLWGRNIYDSIRKFLQFQLTVNVVAVTLTLISSATIQQEVLTPIQMLWVNMIMDTMASLALATEAPEPSLLKRKPHNKLDHMVSKKMFKHIIGQAIYQLAVLFFLLFYGENFIPEYEDSLDDELAKIQKRLNEDSLFAEEYRSKTRTDSALDAKYNLINGDKFIRSGRLFNIRDPKIKDYEGLEKEYGPSRHFTFIFNTFVWLQIFNFLNSRRIRDEINIFHGIFNNSLFSFIVFLIIFLQAVIISNGSYAFHCYNWYRNGWGGAGLHINQWLICIAFGSGGLIVGFLLKLMPEEKCLEVGSKSADPIHSPSKILDIRRGSSAAKRFSSYVGQNLSFQKSSFNAEKPKSSFSNRQNNNNAVWSKQNLPP